jgi:radical SAM protein with 4Fe4S-binding SPASM domain
MSDDRIMMIAEKIISIGVFSVIITGGEPLIRKNLIRQLIRYLKRSNIDVSLNTNLLLLDSTSLRDFIDNGLDGILVSCPSSNPVLYNFMTGGGIYSNFYSQLRMLIDSGQHFSVNMVVNQNNLDYIRQTAISMQNLGVKIFSATPMALNLQTPDKDNLLSLEQVRKLIDDLVWIQKNLDLTVDIFEAIPKCAFPIEIRKSKFSFLNRKCQAGKTIVTIANNGDVRPCSHNPKVYGNLFVETIENIWMSMSDWRDKTYLPDRCSNCKLVKDCYGGCRITAKTYTGHCQGEDPWMDFPITEQEIKISNKKIYDLNPSTTIVFSKRLRWRQEKQDRYLISSTRSNRNITMVNESLFNFVCFLKETSPVTIHDLCQKTGHDFKSENDELKNILIQLIQRDFVSLF